jgi:HAD superfamily 5'-nucleotidase-like hydrolase
MDDKAQKNVGAYDFWDDIFNGLVHMYTRENYQTEVGGFFKELKQYPDKYIHKTNKAVMSWLKEMRKTKTTFLMTGSYIDFANFTATTAMGADWREYFDFIVVFAKKPGFFTGARPFVRIVNNKEMEALKQEELEINGIYSQGNWREMLPVLGKHCGKSKPKFLYIGDNLIQDIYTPNKYTKCDTIAIAEEMMGEGMKDHPELHPDSKLLYSNTWGSYFSQDEEPSIWADVIQKYSKICVPSVEILAQYPLDYEFNCFTESESSKGFYPNEPLFVVK